MAEATAMDLLEIPTIGLKESLNNLKILYQGGKGDICPRCSSNEFRKLGTYKYKGNVYPRKLCCNCGYVFSTINPEKEGYSHNRASRIFNLDNKKVDDLIEDALLFGVIKVNGDGTYSKANPIISKVEMYHNVPLYHYLIETVGYDLKRSVFEDALKHHPDQTIARVSKIKRDTLWRKYQEIAVELFVCEKMCKFSRTCKKDQHERNACDTVKKSKPKKKILWRADIEL